MTEKNEKYLSFGFSKISFSLPATGTFGFTRNKGSSLKIPKELNYFEQPRLAIRK